MGLAGALPAERDSRSPGFGQPLPCAYMYYRTKLWKESVALQLSRDLYFIVLIGR